MSRMRSMSLPTSDLSFNPRSRSSGAGDSLSPAQRLHKVGFLQKKGERNKDFKKRYFELARTSLTYYAKPGGKAKGAIDLAGANVAADFAQDLPPFCFSIHTPTRRYVLQGENDHEVSAWIDALNTQQISSIQRQSEESLDPNFFEQVQEGLEEVGEGDGEDDGAEQVAPGLQLDLEVAPPEPEPVVVSVARSVGPPPTNKFSMVEELERLKADRRNLLAFILQQASEGDEPPITLPKDCEERPLDLEEVDADDLLVELQNGGQVDLTGAAREYVVDSEVFPAAELPELRHCFSERELVCAAYEALLCCTLVDDPNAAAPPSVNERDTEVLQMRIRNQLEYPNRKHTALLRGMSVLQDASNTRNDMTPVKRLSKNKTTSDLPAQDENDDDSQPMSPTAETDLIDAEEEVGLREDQLTPLKTMLWRWRCLFFRRPQHFGSFEDFRDWQARQLAMVASAAALHIRDNPDHKWMPPAGMTIEAIVPDAEEQETAWHEADAAPSIRTSELEARIWVTVRRVRHVLDYGDEFDDSAYLRALTSLRAVLRTVFSQPLDENEVPDPSAAFAPMNHALYKALTGTVLFKSAAGDDDGFDEFDDDFGLPTPEKHAGGPGSIMMTDAGEMESVLRHMWEPMALSPFFHQVTVSAAAFARVQQSGCADCGALATLKECCVDLSRRREKQSQVASSEARQRRGSAELAGSDLQELEQATEMFELVTTYCEDKLMSVFEHFDEQSAEAVQLLSAIWCAILPSAADASETMHEAVKAAVASHHDGIKRKVNELQMKDWEEDFETEAERNAAFTAEMAAELVEDGKWHVLLSSMDFPGSEGDGRSEYVTRKSGLRRALSKMVEMAQTDVAIIMSDAPKVDSSMMGYMRGFAEIDAALVKLSKHIAADEELPENERPLWEDSSGSLLSLEKLTATAVGPWVEEKQQQFETWKDSSIRDERWEPFIDVAELQREVDRPADEDDGDCKVAASVVDMLKMITQSVQGFMDSGLFDCTTVKLRARFVDSIAETLEHYATGVVKSCGVAPKLPMMKPPVRGAKLSSSVPKRARPPTDIGWDEAWGSIESDGNGIQSLIIRLNSLDFANTLLDEGEDSDSDSDSNSDDDLDADAPPIPFGRPRKTTSLLSQQKNNRSSKLAVVLRDGKKGKGSLDGQTRLASVQGIFESSLRELRNYIGQYLALSSHRDILLDGLYLRSTDFANTGRQTEMLRMDTVLGGDTINNALELIMTQTVFAEKQNVLLEVFQSFLSALEYVVLANDEWRIYTPEHQDIFETDLAQLQDFFKADGDGIQQDLHDIEVVKRLQKIFIHVEMPSEDLIDLYKEKRDRGNLDMYREIALIMSHRRDEGSKNFFKKVIDKEDKVKKIKRVMVKDLAAPAMHGHLDIEAAALAVLDPASASAGSAHESEWLKRYFVVWPGPVSLMSGKKPPQQLCANGIVKEKGWLFCFEEDAHVRADAQQVGQPIPLTKATIAVIPRSNRICIEITLPDRGTVSIGCDPVSMPDWMEAIGSATDG